MIVRLPPVTIHNRLTPAEVGETLGYWIADYHLDEVAESANAGKDVKVGICDTGIAQDHLLQSGDLHDAVFAQADFTRSRHQTEDLHGHGTHVAGIIAARSQNGRGVAGVAPLAQLAIAKVLGDTGSGSDKSVATGIKWCANEGCQVINCSLGGGNKSPMIQAAIDYANSKGAVVVCASGNESGRVGWPAADDNNICVGAIDASKVLAPFSNRGNEVDFVAPGVEILSTYARGGYATLSGTSMATPWISGLLALVISKNNGAVDLAVASVRELLKNASIDLGPPGRDIGYGNGVPDPRKVIEPSAVVVPPPVTGRRVRIEGVMEDVA